MLSLASHKETACVKLMEVAFDWIFSQDKFDPLTSSNSLVRNPVYTELLGIRTDDEDSYLSSAGCPLLTSSLQAFGSVENQRQLSTRTLVFGSTTTVPDQHIRVHESIHDIRKRCA